MKSTEQENYNASELKLKMLPDPPADSKERRFGDPNHALLLHDDVINPKDVPLTEPIKKRLHLVLQHLAAHGRTSVIKGCKDNANRGWRRSPLGGNHGSHYYLWWAPKGTRQIDLMVLPE